MRKIKAWAGIWLKDKVYISQELYTRFPIMAIYPTKKVARLLWQHVVPVIITYKEIEKEGGR